MPSFPKPQAPPPPPTFADYDVQGAGNNQRAAAMGGIGSTILTGGSGLMAPASTSKKQLTGQ